MLLTPSFTLSFRMSLNSWASCRAASVDWALGLKNLRWPTSSRRRGVLTTLICTRVFAPNWSYRRVRAENMAFCCSSRTLW